MVYKIFSIFLPNFICYIKYWLPQIDTSPNPNIKSFVKTCKEIITTTTTRTTSIRASPTVLGMWSCIVKLDEENPSYASLAQENGFGSA
jgi:hypothetical protein